MIYFIKYEITYQNPNVNQVKLSVQSATYCKITDVNALNYLRTSN